MAGVENFYPVVATIRETGAGAGDLVRCVSSSDPRYTKGEVYQVVLHFGRAHILSGHMIAPTKEEQKRGIKPYQTPVEGFGARWQRVGDEE